MARFGMMVEKSGVEPSGSVGVNPRSRQTWMEIRSKD